MKYLIQQILFYNNLFDWERVQFYANRAQKLKEFKLKKKMLV